MSNAARIREWLAIHQPATMTQIWQGLGMKRQTANTLVGEMIKSGYIVAGEGSKNRTHTLTGKQRAPLLTREEKLQRNRDRCAARRLKLGQIPRAVTRAATEERRRLDRDARASLRAQIRAEAQERIRLKELTKAIRADNAKRKREQAKARKASIPTTEHAAREKRDAARQIVAMRLDAIATAPASQPEAETVDEYLARGGVIERLPPGVWSTPLRVEL